MTIKDLLKLDVSKLTSKTIGAVAKYAQTQVNKSFARWDKQDYKSPAARALEKSGGRISYAGKTLNQRKKELQRAIRYLSDKTRTFQGWREEKLKQIDALRENYGIEVSYNNFDRFFDNWEKMKELNPAIELNEYKYRLMQKLSDQYADKKLDQDTILDRMNHDLDTMVKENEARINEERQGISGAFQ